LQNKKSKKIHGDFAFRIRVGDFEVEINGTREEVSKTIEELPSLMDKVHKAFEAVRPKKVTTLTVKTEPDKGEKKLPQQHPKILPSESCEEAILRLLETDWGKWRPRTIRELKEALKTNKMNYSGRTLTRILLKLARKKKVRRWKTDAGYVYILAEKEDSRGEAE
jgi:hypothetical protein